MRALELLLCVTIGPSQHSHNITGADDSIVDYGNPWVTLAVSIVVLALAGIAYVRARAALIGVM